MTEPNVTDISEESLLRSEAEEARAALQNALMRAKNSLMATGDPKLWATTHPWISVGVAAAAGFAAASALVPAPGQRTTNKWAKMMHRLAPDQQGGASAASKSPSEGVAQNGAPSVWTAVIDAIFELAKVAVANLLASMAQAKTAAAAAHHDGSEGSSQANQETDGAPPQHVG